MGRRGALLSRAWLSWAGRVGWRVGAWAFPAKEERSCANKRVVCRGGGQSRALSLLTVSKRAEKKCSCAFLICTAGDFSRLMIYRALMLKR